LLLKQLLKPVGDFEGVNYGNAGGTYPNLFCGHPPFQIDGNFGGAAGISEMLVQSQGKDQVIRFLPALPSAAEWKNGSVKGFRTRGAFIVDMSWSNGLLLKARINALQSGTCKLLLPAGKSIVDAKGRILVGKKQVPDVVEFAAAKGSFYQVI
jgi:alpha-L-fucosidase 2